MRSFRRPQHRQFALWLALAAVMLRALLPDGMMLERAGSGAGMALAICYASPLSKLRADQGLPQKSHNPSDCVFSAAAGPALPSAPQAYPPAWSARAAFVARFAPAELSVFAGGRPPARAPPAIS